MDEFQDSNTAAEGGPAPEKPADQPDPKELQRELDSLKNQIAEKDRMANFWHEQATKTQKAPEKPEAKEEVPEIDELDEAELVDIIAGNDKSQFSKVVQSQVKKVLKSLGVTTQKDVEKFVSSKLQESHTASQSVAELAQQYPELLDPESDLRKETAKQLELVDKDESFKGLSDVGKLKVAAKLAAAEISAIAPRQKRGGDPEAARLARIAAQQGSTGSRGGSKREGSEELSDEELAACKLYKITPEQFAKNKKELKMFR